MGFWGRFTKPKAKLSLKTEKREFFLGEKAKGFAEIKSEEEFDIRGITVGLNCDESLKKTRMVSKVDDEGNEESHEEHYWDKAILYSDSVKVCNELHISQGFFLGYPFALTLPSVGRGTYHSVDRNLQWVLWAVMKVMGRHSIEVKYEMIVAKPSATQKEVIREVVLIPCSYCGGLMPQTSLFCPNCGARRKA